MNHLELEQQRKTQIIETASRLLALGPHRALTLEKVARDTGVSKGMVTHYFKSKEQLITDAITHYLEEHHKLVRPIIRSDRPVRERLTELMNLTLASREMLDSRLRFQVEAWSFIKDCPKAFEKVRQSYVEFRKECLEILEDGIEEECDTTADAESLYMLFYSLLDGLSLTMALDPIIDPEGGHRKTFMLFEHVIPPNSTKTDRK